MLNKYLELVVGFREQGYKCVLFPELESPNGQLILRHDVDFDCDFARVMAEAEAEEGIKSTYFFLLTSPNYNLLSDREVQNVRAIKEMGHDIGLHFDCSLYPHDYRDHLRNEIETFEIAVCHSVEMISLHRPPHDLSSARHAPLVGVEHTYLDKYMTDITYMSDSNNAWKYGHPYDSEAFKQVSSFQLLIHPIWWIPTSDDLMGKLHQLTLKRQMDMFSYMRKFCRAVKDEGEKL